VFEKVSFDKREKERKKESTRFMTKEFYIPHPMKRRRRARERVEREKNKGEVPR